MKGICFFFRAAKSPTRLLKSRSTLRWSISVLEDCDEQLSGRASIRLFRLLGSGARRRGETVFLYTELGLLLREAVRVFHWDCIAPILENS